MISGLTASQLTGLWISSASLDTIFGFVSSLVSMMRAIGNGGSPAPQALLNCVKLVPPPVPPSSTEIT